MSKPKKSQRKSQARDKASRAKGPAVTSSRNPTSGNPTSIHPHSTASNASQGPTESRAADAITVAWMLTVVASLVAESIALISWGIVVQVGPEELPRGIVLLPIVMWATSAVTGTLDLALAWLTCRIRSTPPPRPILIAAIVIGGLPLAALLFLAL